MKSKIILLSKILLLVFVMINFIHFVTYAIDNSKAYLPNWYSGNKGSCGTNCYLTIDYYNTGFPVQISGSSIHGLYWLTWAINYTFAGIIAIILGWLLIKKEKIGLAVCTILLVYFRFRNY